MSEAVQYLNNFKKKSDPRLLRKKYPRGKHGYWLEFYVNEFWEAIEAKNMKELHIHVVFKSSGGKFLKVDITHDKRNIEVVRPKIKKKDLRDDAKKMYNFIRDELESIMEEVMERLFESGLRLSKDYRIVVK